MTIVPYDVTLHTWDQNIGVHREDDDEVLRRTISPFNLPLG